MEPILEPGILLLAPPHLESCCTPAALVLGRLHFKSLLHVGLLLRLQGFPKTIHNCPLTPLPCLFPAPLPYPAPSELVSPPYSSAQPPLLHALFLATEIPFPTTEIPFPTAEHTLLTRCLMRLSTPLSCKLPILWPSHIPEEEAEGLPSASRP